MSKNRHEIANLKTLSSKFRGYGNASAKAMSLALNKGATVAKNESVDVITSRVNLKRNYVKSKLPIISRASPSNPSVTIGTREIGTQLTRYPNVKTSVGYSVSVNTGSGFKNIAGAFKVGFRGTSGKYGIAISAKRAVRMKNLFTGERLAEVKRLNNKTKGRGLVILKSRSVGQLFKTVRDDVRPYSFEAIRREYFKDLKRLSQ